MRLRSEEDLAALLKTGRRRIRDSLIELERKGVLVRRRGSGTYLRCIPESVPSATPVSASIPPEDLLAPRQESGEHPVRLAPTAAQKQLHLALWSDLQLGASLHQATLSGMAHHADRMGHRLTIHSLLDRERKPLAQAEIKKMILRHQSDGQLVISRWAERFIPALEGSPSRTIYFTFGTEPIEVEPLMTLDTRGAAERGVALLAAAGFSRIALIGIGEIEGHSGKAEGQGYESAMSEARLRYRQSIGVGLGISRIVPAVRELFQSDNRPDAVYVADDHVLTGVVEAFSLLNVVPGRDIGVITHANVGSQLPEGTDWSRLEFDPSGFGELLIDELLKWVQVGGSTPSSLAVGANWRPGQTHLRAS